MSVAVIDNAAKTVEYAPEFFHTQIKNISYASIPPMRRDLEKFLMHRGITASYAGMVMLSVTEVLTNIVKHPVRKADFVEVCVTLRNHALLIDVADNATPFADVDAKCNAALTHIDPVMGLAESGYGLGCILQQHEKVTYISMNESTDSLNHFIIHDTVRLPDTGAGKTPLRKKSLFLVDDDPVSLAIHQRMLENVYDVMTFSHARDALKAFAVHKPDIIISDLSMPDMDGIALRKALSAEKNGDTVPFIFLSGHRGSAHNPYISKIGVDDFLFKPISKERLLAVSARLLNRSAQITHALQGRFHQDMARYLKPSLPEKFGDWKIRTLSQMAEAGGGDFTLHHETPTHMLAVLADVMGHGQQAKFFSYAYAGYLRSIFRTQSGNADPAHFLERLSTSVEGDDFLESTLMTCIAFQFSDNGDVKVATAGHPSPIIIGAEKCRPMDIAGPLPGLVGESRYVQCKRRLARGEKILFATDGFFQVFRAEELVTQIGFVAHRGYADIAGHLWLEYQSRNENSDMAKDDATLIIAEYGG